MKEHVFAQMVNELTQIGMRYHDHQSLRQRISACCRKHMSKYKCGECGALLEGVQYMDSDNYCPSCGACGYREAVMRETNVHTDGHTGSTSL